MKFPGAAALTRLMPDLRIGFWNVCGGLATRVPLMEGLMDEVGTDVIFFSETWMKQEATIWTRLDFVSSAAPVAPMERRGGRHHSGVMAVFRPGSVFPRRLLTVDPDGRFVAVQIGEVNIAGVYIKPTATEVETRDLLQEVRNVIGADGIIVGDFNARHADFGDTTSNQRGRWLQRWAMSWGWEVARETGTETWTYQSRTAAGSCSTVDLAFGVGRWCGRIVDACTWRNHG